MGMYVRGGEGVKYHTVLLSSPKNPDPKKTETVQYHAKNVIVEGVPTWVFEAQKVKNRVERLLSVALLGKTTATEDTVTSLLQTVPVVQGDKDWRCRHWAWSAIQSLVDASLIKPVPVSPEDLWNKLYTFTEKTGYKPEAPVPTIDNEGNLFESEIGPIEGSS